jgi:hypothetical protein
MMARAGFQQEGFKFAPVFHVRHFVAQDEPLGAATDADKMAELRESGTGSWTADPRRSAGRWRTGDMRICARRRNDNRTLASMCHRGF